jgi:hypothetical protein
MPQLNQIEWEEVDSSNVSAVFLHEPTNTICVQFNNGGLYSYIVHHKDMPTVEIYGNLRMATSVGRYLNNVIKAFPYTRWDSEQDLLAHLNI